MEKNFSAIRKFFSIIIAASLVLGTTGVCTTENFSAEESSQAVQPSNPVYDASTDTTKWDYVYFGEYPQTRIAKEDLTEEIINAEYNEDGDTVVNGEKIRRLNKQGVNYYSRTKAEGFFDWYGVNDGYAYFKYEPMKWRVLQNEGDTLLLLSDMVIDCQRYEKSDGKITWAQSPIRDWLNSYFQYKNIGWSFLNTGFTKEEEKAIVTSKLSNPNNPFHGTNGGEDTEDKVFLMSVPEMTNENYGFPSNYMTYSNTRQLRATDYARAMGVWMGSHNDLYAGNAIWMLRTPGSYQQTISLVYWFGHVYQDGYYSNTPYYGVAPALRVDASSDVWKYAGNDNDNSRVKLSSANTETVKITLAEVKDALTIALKLREGTEREMETYDLNRDKIIDLDEVCVILRFALRLKDYPQETPGPDNSSKPQVTGTPESSSNPQQTVTPSATPSLIPVSPKPVQTIKPKPTPTLGPLVQKDCDASGRIWIAGDSIADYHSKSGYSQPLYGWGELIGGYFTDNRTTKFSNSLNQDEALYNKMYNQEKFTTLVVNTALSSRSSKSFTRENNYTSIMNLMKEGDYLLISFGHNDERADVDLYTDPFGSSSDERSFKWFLKNYYIDPAIRAGVQPVLISPIPRRYFYKGEFINPQLHTPYGKAMKELKEEYAKLGINIYYIDLHSHMLKMYEELGEAGTIPLHGKYGSTMDNTHVSQQGATVICEYIISQMKEQKMNIDKFIKED